jgi:hypothetical protein
MCAYLRKVVSLKSACSVTKSALWLLNTIPPHHLLFRNKVFKVTNTWDSSTCQTLFILVSILRSLRSLQIEENIPPQWNDISTTTLVCLYVVHSRDWQSRALPSSVERSRPLYVCCTLRLFRCPPQKESKAGLQRWQGLQKLGECTIGKRNSKYRTRRKAITQTDKELQEWELWGTE